MLNLDAGTVLRMSRRSIGVPPRDAGYLSKIADDPNATVAERLVLDDVAKEILEMYVQRRCR
jgi:hypothetical protein